MRTHRYLFVLAAGLTMLGYAYPVRAADSYAVDPVHSSVSFKVDHMGISTVHGRFNNIGGKFTVDGDDAAKGSFSFTAKVDSIDTNQKARDGHLKSPDFFDAKQFPLITLESTAVKAIDGGMEVTGDLTMHGVTKPITFKLKGGKTAKDKFGGTRIGYTADFAVKRGDFGMEKFKEMLSDEIQVSFGFEGVKK